MPLRILVTDDSRFMRKTITKVLTESFPDAILDEAENGLVGLHRLNEVGGGYDLVLTDLDMPQMGGLDFLKNIRQHWPDLPAIVITANDTPENIMGSLRLSADALVPKPFERDELVGLINDTLAAARESVSGIKVRSVTPNWIELDIPSHPVYVRRVHAYLSQIELDMPETERTHLLYVYTELVQNAMEHGNRWDPSKVVTFSYQRFPDMRILRIHDQGDGFDLRNIPHAVGISNEATPWDVMKFREELGLRPGGLGIASAFRMVDYVLYNQKGNEVMMIRKLDESDPDVSTSEDGELELTFD